MTTMTTLAESFWTDHL